MIDKVVRSSAICVVEPSKGLFELSACFRTRIAARMVDTPVKVYGPRGGGDGYEAAGSVKDGFVLNRRDKRPACPK